MLRPSPNHGTLRLPIDDDDDDDDETDASVVTEVVLHLFVAA